METALNREAGLELLDLRIGEPRRTSQEDFNLFFNGDLPSGESGEAAS